MLRRAENRSFHPLHRFSCVGILEFLSFLCSGRELLAGADQMQKRVREFLNPRRARCLGRACRPMDGLVPLNLLHVEFHLKTPHSLDTNSNKDLAGQ